MWFDLLAELWQPTPEFLPGESHGQRSLEGYGPQDCKESDMAVVTQHWVRSLGGEDPLEEGMQPTPVFLPGGVFLPMNRGAWRASVRGVTKSQDMTKPEPFPPNRDNARRKFSK